MQHSASRKSRMTQQFRNLGLVEVTPEEKCPEITMFCRSSVKETLAEHFPRGVKSLGSIEAGGIPQDSSGWQIGRGEQGLPSKTRLSYDERVERQWPALGTRRYYYGARARGVDCLRPFLAPVKAA